MRAFVWRQIKRAGAVYLRDGVCVLPQTLAAEAALSAIAQRVLQFGGQAALVRDARLEAGQARQVRKEMKAARAVEYAAIQQDAAAFLEHIHREAAHRDFSEAEVQELEGDGQKLQHWYGQVKARDYVNSGPPASIDGVLRACEKTLAQLLEGTSDKELGR